MPYRIGQEVRNMRIHEDRDSGLFGVVQSECFFNTVTEMLQYFVSYPEEFHRNFHNIDLLHPICKVGPDWLKKSLWGSLKI